MTSYRRMRRQARQIRRSGMQPMMFINGDPSQFPAPVGVILARFAWRYRSELAPLGVAAMTLLAACWTHAALAKWWAVILAGSVGGRVAHRVPRREVRTRVHCGTRLRGHGHLPGRRMARHGHGPGTVHATASASPGNRHGGSRGAVVGAPTPAREGARGTQARGMAGHRAGDRPRRLRGHVRHRRCMGMAREVPARTRPDHHRRDRAGSRDRIRPWDIPWSRPHIPTPDDLANRFELRVLDTDPHADAIPWPGPSARSITEPVELGPFEDAAPCRVLFLRRHALFAGTTGSGKSGGLNVLMANLTACQDVIIWGIDLKKGMELGPWQECLDRLATTPEQAATLLRDAVAILQARAAYLAAHGRRTWEPSPEMPALVIIIDEYAELAEQAPDAMDDTDSIARLGRALAVTLVAATQRPTQKAMGQGAVRSQMDMRICFRVREPRDVDLVLGQGMLTAGWNAHKLNAPGKFLISAPEHDIPRRARAYLVTDQAVADTAARHAQIPRQLDDISRAAIERAYADQPRTVPANIEDIAEERADANSMLWAALSTAPPEGIPVSELITITGMSRRWVFWRLKQLAERGEAVQTVRGHWRAAS